MSGLRFTYAECGKTIVRGTMDAGISNVIYMELYSGPKMANGRCGKTIDTGTIDRGSTVYLDNKEICCVFKTWYIIPALFSTKCHLLHIFLHFLFK